MTETRPILTTKRGQTDSPTCDRCGCPLSRQNIAQVWASVETAEWICTDCRDEEQALALNFRLPRRAHA